MVNAVENHLKKEDDVRDENKRREACKALVVCIWENVDLIAVAHISATNYGVNERRSNNYAFTRLVLESMYYIAGKVFHVLK